MEKKQNKIEFQIEFGKQIEKLRTEQKLSYRQLAQRCDVDFSNISKIEKGEINIQLSTVLELAKGLSITLKELFDFKYEIDNE
ncbi:helix-turn-helix domain-containing protein [Flavobacterium phycosphaerae]|uniref:helix-turn-helix domain-containing protein n=1 Tax=Flavobacterium phycosphaerae TaxID=2697515 RepID=UPI00138B08AB|nr:helix-turn-helix transcriptional regulator [Flavobacterium phycosphaerae]